MSPCFLDEHAQRNSPLHHADPRVKVVCSLLLVTTVVASPRKDWMATGVAGAMLLAFLVLSRLPLGWVARRLVAVLPFSMVTAASLPFMQAEGPIVFRIPVVGWPVSAGGLHLLAVVVARSAVCVLAVLLLVATTGFQRFIESLEDLRVPSVLVLLQSFMYRYLFLLSEEMTRLLRARDARGKPGRFRDSAAVAGSLVGTLFVRSHARSERIAKAMLARGYDGKFPRPTSRPVPWRDLGWASVFTVLLVITVAVQHLQ